MSSDLRKKLINELSELSLSLSDGLERIGEFDADNESNSGKKTDTDSKKSADQNDETAQKTKAD